MTLLEWLLLLAALPPTAWAVVTAGVTASGIYAWTAGRRDPLDDHQQQAFEGAVGHGLIGTSLGMSVEGFWQLTAFGLQGLRLLRLIRDQPLDPAGGPPVVLVAGYLENAGQMAPLARRLRQRGYQPVLVDLPSTLRSVAANAAFLEQVLEQVCAASGYARVGFVGHSMGGVVARTYVHAADDPRLAVAVTLGSPHRGTHLARLGPGKSCRDMRPDSEHMRAHPPHRVGQVPIHTVIATHDNIVSPAWSGVLQEGENLVLPRPVGHLSILYLPSVAARVLDWLDGAEYPRAERQRPAATPAES